jgi:prepilin-type N-terminal cleavage/methylation domain-containing protein
LKTELLDKDEKNIVEAGFTLVELLIVIVIMGILAGIVVFAVGNLTNGASSNACKTEADAMATAAEAHRATYGAYPAAAANLWTFHSPLDATGSGLLKTQPKSYAAAAAAGKFTYNTATGQVDTSQC